MESSFTGFVLDPSKCSKLGMEEKRELVYEISKWAHGAPEMLQSWSRRELLQVLCAEMGKERKYTGLSKLKLIEQLLKIVSEKKSGKWVDAAELEPRPAPANSQNSPKRQRKTDHPSRLPSATNNVTAINGDGDQGNAVYCQNSACKATIQQQDAFCKRCSCCICYNYDDNKDPSLWLVCSSEPPYQGDSCGLSCHLDCALKHEKAGITQVGQHGRLDGSFYCVSCGKVNDFLRCWKKQLVVAKDTRRVDTLCYRVLLCQKLLNGTEKYQKLQEIVDMAAKKLEADVGTLTLVHSPAKKARGIVNRLPSGQEVQKLCTSAVELLDSMLSCAVLLPTPNPEIQGSCVMSPPLIRFENVCPTSLTMVFISEDASSQVLTMWHRKADDMDYPVEPTCTMVMPNSKFTMSDLSPATEYLFKVVSFCGKGELGTSEARIKTSSSENSISRNLVVEGSQSPATNSSSVSNLSSEADESNNIIVEMNEKDKSPGCFLSYLVKKELVESDKLSDDAGKVIYDSQKTNSGLGQEQTLRDSVSALDEEECAMVEVGPISNLTIQMESQRDISNSTDGNQLSDVDNKHSPEGQLVEDLITDKGRNTPIRGEMEIVPSERTSEAVLPITPCKLEIGKDGPGRSVRPKAYTEELDDGSGKGEEPRVGSSPKMQSGGRWDGVCGQDGSLDGEYEYSVKLIRWLECHGHIEKNFRVKFLTWYSLRATPQERRIVKVYVDTLSDDPACLAGQLVDTFTECISIKRSPAMPTGFCMRLWH